jgi:uncharacterized protein (TIGR03000 family)
VATTPSPDAAARKEIERLRDEVDKLRQQLEMERKKKSDETATAARKKAAPAHVTIRLPADAKLYVDNVACPLTSATRSFDTPALDPGRKYFYTVRAEVMRNGQTVVQAQRVEMTAGQKVTVTLNKFAAATTSAP